MVHFLSVSSTSAVQDVKQEEKMVLAGGQAGSRQYKGVGAWLDAGVTLGILGMCRVMWGVEESDFAWLREKKSIPLTHVRWTQLSKRRCWGRACATESIAGRLPSISTLILPAHPAMTLPDRTAGQLSRLKLGFAVTLTFYNLIAVALRLRHFSLRSSRHRFEESSRTSGNGRCSLFLGECL